MPLYSYLCDCGIIEDHPHPIGEAPRTTICTTCGDTARLVIGAGVQIAPSALENKGEEVRRIDAREDEWHKDMPAYKRMRNKGLQPKGIDGAAMLEDRTGDQMDIELGHLYSKGVTKQRVLETAEQAQEIMASAEQS